MVDIEMAMYETLTILTIMIMVKAPQEILFNFFIEVVHEFP